MLGEQVNISMINKKLSGFYFAGFCCLFCSCLMVKIHMVYVFQKV